MEVALEVNHVKDVQHSPNRVSLPGSRRALHECNSAAGVFDVGGHAFDTGHLRRVRSGLQNRVILWVVEGGAQMTPKSSARTLNWEFVKLLSAWFRDQGTWLQEGM